MVRASPARLLLALPLAAEAPAPPLNVGTTAQLLVDDRLVASMTPGLSRRMHSPALTPIIRPDAPWEQGLAIGTIGTSVVQEGDGRLRLYYSLRNASLGCGEGDQPPCVAGAPPQPNFEPSAGPIRTALAESTDGGMVRAHSRALPHHPTTCHSRCMAPPLAAELVQAAAAPRGCHQPPRPHLPQLLRPQPRRQPAEYLRHRQRLHRPNGRAEHL